MKCDTENCGNPAEFGWNGEETVYCSDCYNKRSEAEDAEEANKKKTKSSFVKPLHFEFEGQR